MRLKFLPILLVITCLISFSCKRKTEQAAITKKGLVQITLDYEKQPGPGSNQWAIWIENAEQELIKTIYVTSFTADGGYIPRPACTPIWVSKADPDHLSGDMIDSFSGATPISGLQTYAWDLTDNNGNPVPNGSYVFVVEATLWGESEVIFKAPISIGEKEASVTAEPVFTSENNKNKEMIKSVTAKYLFTNEIAN